MLLWWLFQRIYLKMILFCLKSKQYYSMAWQSSFNKQCKAIFWGFFFIWQSDSNIVFHCIFDTMMDYGKFGLQSFITLMSVMYLELLLLSRSSSFKTDTLKCLFLCVSYNTMTKEWAPGSYLGPCDLRAKTCFATLIQVT